MKKLVREQILTGACLVAGVGLVLAVYMLPFFIGEKR